VTGPTITPELQELLESRLDTLEKLELALALRDAGQGDTSIAELARELQIGHDVLQQLAHEVARTELVAVENGAVKLLVTPEERALLDEAAALYEHDRRFVMRLMSKIAMDQIRRMAARSFADAFTFRKKKKDNDRG
jgi:hypothetical protein